MRFAVPQPIVNTGDWGGMMSLPSTVTWARATAPPLEDVVDLCAEDSDA